MKDFALLSHVLPPSPSGQGVILYRLLEGLNPDSYYVISNKNYDNLDQQTLASHKLKVPYHSLTSEPAIYALPQHSTAHTIQSRLKNSIKATPLYTGFRWLKTQKQQLALLIKSLLQIHKRSQQITMILKENPAKTLIACTGDMSNIPAAYLACRRANIHFVPYIFDDYVYQWTGLIRFVVRLMAAFLFKRADHILVTNEVMADEYKRRYGVDSTIIRNLCPIPDAPAQAAAFKNTLSVVYAGATYAHADALKNLVDALQQLNDARIRLHIYTMTGQDQLKQQGIYGSFVEVHPYIPQKDIVKILSQADILFLPLAFKSKIPEIIQTASPGKMAEYMALARPILVHAPANSFISLYFRKNNCGVVVDVNDAGQLARALSTLIEDETLREQISQQARKLAIAHFDIQIVQNQFITAINRIGLYPTK